MAKVKNQSLPHTDILSMNSPLDPNYFGDVWRGSLSEGYYPYPESEDSVVRKSSRLPHPSEAGPGTQSQESGRLAFKMCADLWRSLPINCDGICDCFPITTKQSVHAAKQEYGVVCSYYDLFMRCCLNYVGSQLPEDSRGIRPLPTADNMPTHGECFPADCPGGSPGQIGYDTLEMLPGESQTFELLNAVPGVCYKWGISPDDFGSWDPDTLTYTAPAEVPSGSQNVEITLYRGNIECGQIIHWISITVTGCDDSDLSWDDPNSADTVARNGNADVAIIDGTGLGGPFSWAIAGTGFTLNNPDATGITNSVHAGPTACGSATITVTGCGNNVVIGYVRCTTGKWVVLSTCGAVCGFYQMCNSTWYVGNIKHYNVYCAHPAPPCSDVCSGCALIAPLGGGGCGYSNKCCAYHQISEWKC